MQFSGKAPDPHNYTTGRWLRHDALERKARIIRFDFDALCRKITSLCPGAHFITSYEKMEGGSNRVFIFHTDNAQRIVARLPFSVAGPPRYTTSSEVATIQYLQSVTSIPIPKILDWSDDTSNAIGSEYIIMEHAAGVCLAEKWPSMTEYQRAKCMTPIYQKLKEAANLEFPTYGSIYRADTPYIQGSMVPLNGEFCIGPDCQTRYWDFVPTAPRYYHAIEPNRGPWPDLSTYCDGLTDTGISRLPPATTASEKRLPHYHGTIEEHRILLEYCRTITKQMIQLQQMQLVSEPILFHPDLHGRNIFVSDEDPTMLTAILDWQSSSVEPAFWYAQDTPDFAQKVAVSASEDQGEKGTAEQGQGQGQGQGEAEAKAEAKEKFTPESSLRAESFAHMIQSQLPPRLTAPRTMDEAYFRPFLYGHRTWNDGAATFREELIQTSRRWKSLGFEGECAYPMPSRQEYDVHWERYKQFEEVHKLRVALRKAFGTRGDGWVHEDVFEETKRASRELFEEAFGEGERGERVWVSEDGERLTEGEVREVWPFDLED